MTQPRETPGPRVSREEAVMKLTDQIYALREERDRYREALVAIETDTDDDHLRNFCKAALNA